ncbi:glycoside hydrolase family 16 protein [Flagellimonas sp. DF-77]|uniref:glycoside hydrolase family 16 protein n=1 Tax=Flagellimonas algarum TaxID=3230298 RepID=UPI0033938584
MTMYHIPTYGRLFLCILLMGTSVFAQTKPTSQFQTLVWADEFDGEGALDTEKWFHQTQLPPGGNWWGGLIQHYTDRVENSFQADGQLHLVAKRERFTDQGNTKNFTAARLNSKFAFTHGRVEIRAKLPKGVGTWPAIWMLNTNIDEDGAYWDNQGLGTVKWPYCGEIDILEHWGRNQNQVSSAVHNGASFGDQVKNVGGRRIEAVSDTFHTYALDWNEDRMLFSIDGIVHYTYRPEEKNQNTWPYNSDYYLILNIAILPEITDDFTESEMVVDYIRVYQ